MRKLAIITGGTSGIGKEFAYNLAEAGYDITIVGRNKENGLKICKELEEKYGIKSDFLIADLSEKIGLDIVEKHIESLKSLDFLVNGAGFGFNEDFLDVDKDDWESMIFVHNIATMRLCYSAGKIMKKNNAGNIINISSLASFLQVGDPMYSSTKAFVRYFSTNIHYDWKKYGIYVQALCPGFVRTNFFSNAGMNRTPKLGLLNTVDVVKTSLEYTKRKKPICVPGFISKCLKIMIQVLPAGLLYKIINKLN